MMHIFGRNEFGVACFRCGLFNHYAKISEPCSGAYDEKLIAQYEKEIAERQLSIKLIRGAQESRKQAAT